MKPVIFYSLSTACVLALTASAANSTPEVDTRPPKLEELVVTVSKVETPLRQIGAAVSVINADEIQLRGYQSVGDLLRTVPGVAVSNAGGAGKDTAVRIRGEESYRTLVFVDGISVADPSGTQVAARVQHLGSALNVDRVEVLRGPQGFMYGADAGGVINVFTPLPDTFTANIAYEGGSFDSQNITGFIGNGSEKGSFGVSFSNNRTDGFNARVNDESQDQDGYENTTLHFNGRWQASESLALQVVARSIDALNEYDNCGWPTVHDCEEDVVQRVSRLAVTHSKGPLEQRLSLANTYVKRDYLTSGVSGFLPEGQSEKVEYHAAAEIIPALTAVWGADYASEAVESNFAQKTQRHQSGAYAELQTQFVDGLYVFAGARYDDAKAYGEHVSVRVSPALVMRLDHQTEIKFRGSYGTGFRMPSISELTYPATGDALGVELQEETSEGGDLGVEWYRGEAWVSLGVFDQKIENEIYFDLDTFSGYLIAEGISHSQGVEFAFEAPLTAIVSLSGNYTYNKTLTEDDSPRVRRPRRIGNLALNMATSEALKLVANIRGANGAKSLNETDNLPNYAVLDISAQIDAGDHIQLFIRAENIGDKKIIEAEGFNAAGRAVFGGVRYSF